MENPINTRIYGWKVSLVIFYFLVFVAVGFCAYGIAKLATTPDGPPEAKLINQACAENGGVQSIDGYAGAVVCKDGVVVPEP